MKLFFNKKYILPVIFFSYLLSFLVILFLNSIVKSNFQISKGGHRKLLNVTISKVYEKHFSFHPEELKVYGNHLYLLALPNNEIHILDEKANLVDIVGGRGDSIGQYQHIINYYPQPGSIAIADAKNQSVSFVNLQNKTATRVKSTEKLFRVLFLSNRKIITETIDVWKNKQHFNVYKSIGLEKNDSSRIVKLIPQSDYNGLLYDGFFVSNGTDSYYINYFYNKLTGIDSAGQVKFTKSTVDNVPLPSVKVSEGGWATYEGDVKIVNFGAAADHRFVYVLSNFQQKMSTRQIGFYTDLYSVNDGKYCGSFILPEINGINPGKICLLNNRLYVLYKNNLVCFKISDL